MINYEDKEITCDYFDVDMKTNFATAYNNVVVKDPKSIMKAGKIILNKKEINGPGVDRGMVFQQGALFEWLTVAENVNFGLRMKNQNQTETQKKVDEW